MKSLLLAAGLLLAGPPTVQVSQFEDSGERSLRAAIADQAGGLKGEIQLVDGTYTISAGAIPVKGEVVIRGNGPKATSINIAKGRRGFDVAPGTKLTLEKVTLTGGVGVDEGGAAIRANEANVTLREVVVQGNGADNDGGALLVTGGSLTVEKSEFRENFGQSGGALFAVDSAVRITGSTFAGNGASQDGGAAFLSHPRELLVEDTKFEGNTTVGRGGALVVHGAAGSPEGLGIKGTTFDGNTSMNEGGGLFVGSTSNGLGNVPLTLTRATFKANVAAVGGGLAVEDGRVAVEDSTFTGNKGMGGQGGALAAAGDLTVRGTTFADNESETSGGALAAMGTLVLEDSEFNGNRAGASGGGLAWMGAGKPEATANRFAENTAEDGSPDIWSSGEVVELSAATAGASSKGRRSTKWTEPASAAAGAALALVAATIYRLRRRRRQSA
jgi:predicted outer membrane repeat protein